MLTREPENQFDEHAIAVKLLDGRRLGFVPRDINRSPFFPHVVSFGHIRSLGVAEAAGLYGVQVRKRLYPSCASPSYTALVSPKKALLCRSSISRACCPLQRRQSLTTFRPSVKRSRELYKRMPVFTATGETAEASCYSSDRQTLPACLDP